MKKLLSLLLAVVIVFTMSVVLTSCGDTETKDTTAAKEVTTDAPENENEQEPADEDTTDESEDEEETSAGPIKEGTIEISDLVSVELKDGWYTENGLDELWNSVELVNDDISDFLASVTVKVGSIYTEGEGAEYWANATNGNYGDKGKVAAEEINGVTYYHLSGVVDDDTQNIYFTDIDAEHYMEVDIMFMPLEKGLPAFDLITIK